jgi:DNA-binding MarR family transcriptional regulator
MKKRDVRREILFELSDVARAMRTYIDQRARSHGMTRAQWSVLSRIERQEGMNQAELAEALEIQPISLVRLIDRLCAQGLVERRAHAKDRRVNLLHLTNAGRARLEDMRPLGREIALEALAGFSEAEVLGLLDKLLRFKANIKTATAKHGAAHANGSGRHVEVN